MRKAIFVLCALSPFFSMAQAIRVVYDVTGEGGSNRVVLEANDTLSAFGPATKPDAGAFFIKSRNHNSCYTTTRIGNARFYIKDSLHSMNWQLRNDTTTLLGYACLSAKTTFRGRAYTVYYAPDLPFVDGPWKFGGLPGMILWVKADDRFIEWKAVEISQGSNKIADDAVTAAKHNFLEWPEFVEAYKGTITNLIKSMKSNGTIKPGETSQLKISSVEIFYPELQTGNGITY